MKLHLGCGAHQLPGWVNIDSTPIPGCLCHDLRNPLPQQSGTVDFIFNEHFIEHLTREESRRLLTECYRVLKPGGVIRISTPSISTLVNNYIANKVKAYEAVGWFPHNKCQMMNDGMRLWGHQYMFDYDDLKELCLEVGFTKVSSVVYKRSKHIDLCNLECRPNLGELIVEVSK